MNNTKKSYFYSNWWALFLLINIALITITVANFYLPNFSQKWRLIAPFSLHTENNIAAWWSGMTIMLAALLFLNRYKQSSDRNRTSWLAISAIMMILSIDEIGSVHERVGLLAGWLGILPFALILAGLLIYAVLGLLKSEVTRIHAALIIIAFSIYGSVALQEFIEHSYQWKPWMMGIRTGIEEGCELLATFLLLYAAIKQDKSKEKLSILSVIPNQNTFASMKWYAVLGFIVHIIGCYLFNEFGDPSHRGNPMNWYPTSLYFCMALICFYKVNHATDKIEKIQWSALAILFLITSAGIMTNIFMITLPGIYELISTKPNNESYIIVYLIQLLVIGMLLSRSIQARKTLVLPSLIFVLVLVWLEQYIEIIWLRYTILGAFSCWTYYVFTHNSMRIEDNRNKTAK